MELFETEKLTIDEHIAEYIDMQPGFKHLEAVKYSILPEGKRYRSIVSMEIYRLLGGSIENYMKAVVGLEFLHHSSLIFDDLPAMDDSLLRKGKKTVHLAFSESDALLAGIYMQERGRKLLNESLREHLKDAEEIEEADSVITDTLNNLISGQEIDLRKTKTDDELLQSMKLKNSMFYLSVVLPVYLLRKKDKLNPFKKIGLNISLAYQLFDDLRDLESQKTTGKMGGVDEAKKTSIYRFGTAETRKMLNGQLAEIDQVLDSLGDTLDLKKIIHYIFTEPS